MTDKCNSTEAKLEILENVRPIISEKHKFSASLYKNKQSKEPLFSVCANGAYDIDVMKIGAVALIALTVMSVANVASLIKKAEYKRLKRINARLKEEKKLLKK